MDYVLNAVAVGYAILGLVVKDWKAYEKRWPRLLGLLLLLVAGIGGEMRTYQQEHSLSALRFELAATRQVLNVPKAEIESSLGQIGLNMENIEIKDAYVQQEADRTVKFTVAVMNKSKVQAKNGSVQIRICAACEYVEEPIGFQKAPDIAPLDRVARFDRLEAHTGYPIALKIKPPAGARQFGLGVTSRCENCVFRPDDVLLVHY